MIYINLIYEDDLSEMVMFKLLNQFGGKYNILNTYPGHGFGYLKKNIKGFNQASTFTPHFMLTDLDKYECPLDLINSWINFPIESNFIFRIAVKEVETWLLADIEGLSDYFRISPKNFPLNPDIEIDPKNKLIQLAKRSRLRRIKEDIIPINDNAVIGPNYNGCMIEFVIKNWNIQNAIKRSNSLMRAYIKLEQFL